MLGNRLRCRHRRPLPVMCSPHAAALHLLRLVQLAWKHNGAVIQLHGITASCCLDVVRDILLRESTSSVVLGPLEAHRGLGARSVALVICFLQHSLPVPFPLSTPQT